MLAQLFGWRFDWPEFVLGIVFGLLIAWGARRALPSLLAASTWTQQRARTVGEGFTAGAKDRYRDELIRRVETLHLARAVPPQRADEGSGLPCKGICLFADNRHPWL